MNKPMIKRYSGPVYDTTEVDSWMYMFHHACSGCVLFKFDQPIQTDGNVYLNGKLHTDWCWAPVNIEKEPLLVVYVKGYVREFDTTFTVTIADFVSAENGTCETTEFVLNTEKEKDYRDVVYTENEKVALQAANESIVLLKNDGTLPLKADATLNVFGSGFANFRIGSIGAAGITPRIRRTVRQAVADTSDFVLNEQLAEFYEIPNNGVPSDEVMADAKRKSDTAVILLTRGSCENIDNQAKKGEYYLSDEEERLIQAVTSTFDKTVVVLNVAYPIDVRFLETHHVSACLHVSLGGMFAADAMIAALSGRVNPCGKLPDTWPMDYYDSPSSKNFIHVNKEGVPLQTDDNVWSQICYEEGQYVGYRYFTTFGVKTAYPFGYGLSYTTFDQQFVSEAETDEQYTFTFSVTNSGTVAGKDVVQLYVSKPCERFENPRVELCDFAKTGELAAGESTTVTLTVPKKNLCVYDTAAAQWVIASGDYTFYAGSHCEQLTAISAKHVAGDVVVQQVENRVQPPIVFDEMTRLTGVNGISGKHTFLSEEPTVAHTQMHLPTKASEPTAQRIAFADVNSENVCAFVSQFSDEQLCRMNVCWNFSKWEMNIKGIAGMVPEMAEFGVPEYTLADGNSSAHTSSETTGFPCSNAVAATFDKDLVFKIGEAIGKDAVDVGVDCILAPGMNLHRDILCGRHFEYFSEDPLLTGYLAGQQVKGLQSAGISACVKHVVANNCEGVRKRSNSVISERTLRELYLKPFELAIGVKMPDTIMTGYNAVNGEFCDECTDLIDGVFRKEFGFDGFVMSDWNSYNSSDYVAMVRAGVSLLTAGSDEDTYTRILLKGLADGEITREELIRNICYTIAVEAKRKGNK